MERGFGSQSSDESRFRADATCLAPPIFEDRCLELDCVIEATLLLGLVGKSFESRDLTCAFVIEAILRGLIGSSLSVPFLSVRLLTDVLRFRSDLELLTSKEDPDVPDVSDAAVRLDFK